MRTRMVYIVSLLLLCVGCSLEIEPQYEYAGISGNNGCYILRVRMPENQKIVDADLKSHKFTVECDRDRGGWKYSSSERLHDVAESVQFRGANRIDGGALLYFTKEEDPKSKFNPPIGTTKISPGIKEQEEFVIFRTGNWLVIHYIIKNTGLGKLTSNNLKKRYAKNPNNKENIASFKTIDGKMHCNLVFNNQEKRTFLIDKYYGQNETYSSRSGSNIVGENILKWTWQYKIDSNQDKDQ